MMITIVIYTAYPKLLNHYTRLMRQYAVAMMLAFLFLAMNQLESWKTKDHGICIFFGKFISRNSNSTEILPIRIIKIILKYNDIRKCPQSGLHCMDLQK